jgi:hypothetical protein
MENSASFEIYPRGYGGGDYNSPVVSSSIGGGIYSNQNVRTSGGFYNPIGATSVQLANKSIIAANGLLSEIEQDIQESKQIIRARNNQFDDMNNLLRLLTEENENMKVRLCYFIDQQEC